MIEEIIRNYLLQNMSVPVYADVPADPPDKYVVIERTGGGEEEHIRSARVAVQSYGATRYEAATVHEEVLRKLPNIATGDVVSECALNSEYDFTDTTTKRYRYQAYFELIYY